MLNQVRGLPTGSGHDPHQDPPRLDRNELLCRGLWWSEQPAVRARRVWRKGARGKTSVTVPTAGTTERRRVDCWPEDKKLRARWWG